MPIKRAPTRLIAVARKALPSIERSKNTNSDTTSTSATPSTTRDWPEMEISAMSNLDSEKGVVREPSAPKNSRPRPTSTP
ncbi:hypothetical protein D3C71_1881160 [compost metagenome]